ncbi:MAG TPA: HAD family phosphatase [Anaerolineae bacterium]|nr:HAD family phosphatase [Anaerolineae bacterium]
MRFQGIIFDFNGVLWWDGSLQERSWRQFSAELRGWPLSADEIAVHVHGRNNGHTLEYLVGRPVAGEELRELTQQKETIYRRLCLDEGEAFKLSPGAVELLDYLTAHQIPRTIATASEKTNVDFFVEHLHLDRWFDVSLIIYDDGTRPGKPAPDIYLQAAHNLGLAPARCVVVEDSRSGIAAAHAAGIGYIFALGPIHLGDELARLVGVSAAIESLRQLPNEWLFL